MVRLYVYFLFFVYVFCFCSTDFDRQKLPVFKDDQRTFDHAFQYEETPGQMKAIQDIKNDMESDKPSLGSDRGHPPRLRPASPRPVRPGRDKLDSTDKLSN